MGVVKAFNPVNLVKNVAKTALDKFGQLGNTLGEVMKGNLGALFKPQNILAVASMMGGPLGSMVPTAFSLGTALASGRFNPLDLAGLVTRQFGVNLGGQFGGVMQNLLRGHSTIDSFVGDILQLGDKNPLLTRLIGQQLGLAGFNPSDAEALLKLPQADLLSLLTETRGFSLNG